MIANIHNLIHILNSFPLDKMGKNIYLTYELTGFFLKGQTQQETNELNIKWGIYLARLNKLIGVEEYLTVNEISQHLKISKQNVHNILKRQDQNEPVLPFVSTNRGKRVKTSDYINFLNKHYMVTHSASAVQNTENPDE